MFSRAPIHPQNGKVQIAPLRANGRSSLSQVHESWKQRCVATGFWRGAKQLSTSWTSNLGSIYPVFPGRCRDTCRISDNACSRLAQVPAASAQTPALARYTSISVQARCMPHVAKCKHGTMSSTSRLSACIGAKFILQRLITIINGEWAPAHGPICHTKED